MVGSSLSSGAAAATSDIGGTAGITRGDFFGRSSIVTARGLVTVAVAAVALNDALLATNSSSSRWNKEIVVNRAGEQTTAGFSGATGIAAATRSAGASTATGGERRGLDAASGSKVDKSPAAGAVAWTAFITGVIGISLEERKWGLPATTSDEITLAETRDLAPLPAASCLGGDCGKVCPIIPL